jgi:hypothetical protein
VELDQDNGLEPDGPPACIQRSAERIPVIVSVARVGHIDSASFHFSSSRPMASRILDPDNGDDNHSRTRTEGAALAERIERLVRENEVPSRIRPPVTG